MLEARKYLESHPAFTWTLQKLAALRYETSGEAKLSPLKLRLRKDKVRGLYQNGALDARLAEIDSDRPIKRIFVMGCGRSGTWLWTAVMSTFKDVCVLSKEVPVEFFGQLTTTGTTLVLKRNSAAYRDIAQIPQRIGIAYIIRHPYDVLTSANRQTNRLYHVDPERWIGEMCALRDVLQSKRGNMKIVRYEDLVTKASEVQESLSAYFDLQIAAHADDVPSVFRASKAASTAMHGLRKIDARSIGKYKTDPQKLEYLRSIKPRLAGVLDWVAAEFSYDGGLD